MAEELTIDTSTLTKTAIKFGAGMSALLDTEYEYIQYLRNRGGIMGVGAYSGGRRSLLQFDYTKKWHHPTSNFSIPPRRIKPVKPRTRSFPKSRANAFNQVRMQRNIYNQLRNMGLKPSQIKHYFRLQPQIGSQRALEAARNIKPTGSWITNLADDMRNGFQRPDFMTRKNWGFLRPGIRERLGNFLFKKEMGVGTNKTLQPRFSWPKLPQWAQSMKEGTKNWFKGLKFPKLGITMPKNLQGMKMPKVGTGGILTALTLIPTAIEVFNLFKAKRWKDASRLIIKTGVSMATFSLIFTATGAAAVLQAVLSGGTLTPTAILTLAGGTVLATGGSMVAGEGTDEFLKMLGLEDQPTQKNRTGSVITSPTRGILGGTKALVGEANEAEIILPMSKIGDAISAVYREGASIMVGATLAFLGPLASGSPAAASLVNEARRIAKLVGADTDVKVDKIKLPNYLPAIVTNKTNNYLEEDSSEVLFASNKSESEGSGSTTNTSSTTITGTDRWKTILPQGDPLFSSPFGMRWGRMHRGIDIGVWENSPVHAQEGGVVEQIIPKFGEYGGAVVIAHQDGTANLYGHVYDYVVKPGQKIEKGDPLAKIIYYPGSDGSNQSHLHFERFNKSGTRIDPLPYFQQGGASIDAQSNSSGNIDPVNQGGPSNIMRDISSSFVNIGSSIFNRNKQELIDTPVNTTNVGNTNNTVVPIPIPVNVPVVMNRYINVPTEGTNNETKMVIDVFGKGASKS